MSDTRDQSGALSRYCRPGLPRGLRSGYGSMLRCGVGVLLWFVFCSAGCATPKTVGPVAGDDVRAFQAMVEDLSHPRMEGRGVGTRGLERAKDYLIERFEGMGVAPGFIAHRESDDASGDRGSGERSSRGSRYDQPFEIRLSPKVVSQTLEVLDGDGEVVEKARPGVVFNTLGFSGDGDFVGSAVFVGYGIIDPERGYDSYRHAGSNDLLGKVAIAFRYEPQDVDGKSLWARDRDPSTHMGPWTRLASLTGKAKWAAQRGAVGLLVVNPPLQDRGDLKSTRRSGAAEPSAIPVIHISTSLFEKILVTGDDDRDGARPDEVIRGLQHLADRGEGRVVPWKRVVLRGSVVIERKEVESSNIAGVIPGVGGLKDQVVVVGAHYDHLGYGEVGSLAGVEAIHPGADDNASGTAGVLMLAERFARRVSDPRKAPTDRRTLIFVAFTGEERGLLGSSHLVKHLSELRVTSERIVGMVNMDMIGRMKDNKLYVLGTGTGDRWEELVRGANKRVGLDLITQSHPFGGSDHVLFQNQHVPAVHFFTGAHEDYHRPGDTWDKVNSEGGVRVLNVIDGVLRWLWVSPDRMTFNPDAVSFSGQVNAHGGGGAYLGIMPDYVFMDGDDGCGVSSVIPGSPAAQAGVLGGDVIIEWNRETIRNVRELSQSLGDSRPGDKISLLIRRTPEKSDAEKDPPGVGDPGRTTRVVEVIVELGKRPTPQQKTLD